MSDACREKIKVSDPSLENARELEGLNKLNNHFFNPSTGILWYFYLVFLQACGFDVDLSKCVCCFDMRSVVTFWCGYLGVFLKVLYSRISSSEPSHLCLFTKSGGRPESWWFMALILLPHF